MTTKAKYLVGLGQFAATLAALAALTIATLGLTTTAALADNCPNAQLRAENNSTQLPECRAYEQVTAPFKEGFAPQPPVADGGHFTDEAFAYTSSGNFAGDGLGGTFNQYIAARTPGGWQTTSPDPSGPTFHDPGVSADGLSADLGTSLWEMIRADESTDLLDFYLRRPDGSFTRIGPVMNPATRPPGTPGTTFPGKTATVPLAGVSTDLSHVLFQLESDQKFPGDESNGDTLYEYVGSGNERPQLVGVDNTGSLVNPAGTCSGGISSDGRVVLFLPACTGQQLWARIDETTSVNVAASECTRTSGDPGGACNGSGEISVGGMASDGSRVFFTTTQQLVNADTDQTADLYACDIPPGTPAPLGLANPCAALHEISGSAPDARVQSVIRVSPDGSRVYFVAQGLLADNPNALGEVAAAGEDNLYVSQIDASHPAGQTTFVSKLAVDDLETNSAQATADGRYLIFTTANQLLPTDTDESRDVYRYDADTHALVRLSTATSGTGGNTPGQEVVLPKAAISADGSTVVFQTSEALSPADVNNQPDVYAWHEGQVSLISSGRPYVENPGGAFSAITPSGHDIYFSTTAQLTPADIDTNSDIYDARIDGGFPAPAAAACASEACRGALAAQPPVFGPSGSATFNASASSAPPETPLVETRPRPLTRAQRLTRALRGCRAKHNRKKRAACEQRARRAYRSSK